jgi:aspartyl/glutamyl-tRNA(Asn/Gln) amidotransferase subunit C (EC 6.3.5.-)
MSVDRDTIRHMAHLARLALAEEETAALAEEARRILAWVEALAAVDTAGVEPLSAVIPKPQALRADEVTEGDIRPALLANAPLALHGFFAVPKVIE